MLMVNDKIKQVKAIAGLNMIGEIFTITSVIEGSITFSADERFGAGIMTFDEFEKYFEKVESKWTDWIEDEDTNMMYKTNGKKILAKVDGIQTSASCHPDDEFDLDVGLDLCWYRIKLKKAKFQVEYWQKELNLKLYRINKTGVKITDKLKPF